MIGRTLVKAEARTIQPRVTGGGTSPVLGPSVLSSPDQTSTEPHVITVEAFPKEVDHGPKDQTGIPG